VPVGKGQEKHVHKPFEQGIKGNLMPVSLQIATAATK
jgi:hypothetical protein